MQWPCKYFNDGEIVGIMATDIEIAFQFEQGDRPEADALPSLTDDESHNLPATQKGKMSAGVESSNDCLGPRGHRSPFGRGNSAALRLSRVHFRRCGEAMSRILVETVVRKQSANAEPILDG
jgi:hypothetical protein